MPTFQYEAMDHTGKEVKEEDEVKGYQRGEDEYIILEDDELENVALDSTKASFWLGPMVHRGRVVGFGRINTRRPGAKER